jgi:hypothetical protein
VRRHPAGRDPSTAGVRAVAARVRAFYDDGRHGPVASPGRERRSGRRDLRPMSTVTVVFGPDGPTALEIGWGFEEMFSAMLLGSLTATATEPFNVGG